MAWHGVLLRMSDVRAVGSAEANATAPAAPIAFAAHNDTTARKQNPVFDPFQDLVHWERRRSKNSSVLPRSRHVRRGMDDNEDAIDEAPMAPSQFSAVPQKRLSQTTPSDPLCPRFRGAYWRGRVIRLAPSAEGWQPKLRCRQLRVHSLQRENIGHKAASAHNERRQSRAASIAAYHSG